MKSMAHKMVRKFAGDKSGATAIEYGILAAGIGAVVLGALAAFGPGLAAAFQNIAARIGNVP